jgi:hypothetical protein
MHQSHCRRNNEQDQHRTLGRCAHNKPELKKEAALAGLDRVEIINPSLQHSRARQIDPDQISTAFNKLD